MSALVVALGVALLACAPTTLPSTAWPSPIPPSADFMAYLDSFGQGFAPLAPPPGVADWHVGADSFGIQGSAVESAYYGVVTCVDPSKNCSHGLVAPGEMHAYWIVTWGDARSSDPTIDGCPIWATIDAKTGAFFNGNGPPCR